ncbi:hypothetical protein CmeUKMEL1_17060 [Cryptosporidium meleagridis]|uniref:Uncharacterized protein n=1 Tax=Cryptosporidium meleagridis TaxID=93969 RepID=A0A2P4Z5S4_9CRYT|nr:hypothetical protein CmeUKMEL1_17060 [Cryptosporidium meleagridis]
MKLGRLPVLFLTIIYFYGEYLNIEASGVIKKLKKNKNGSFNLEAEETEISFPEDERCKAVGEHIAGKKRTSEYMRKFLACIIEHKGIKSTNLHEKYTKISEKCSKFGFKASESTKAQSLDCIYCYKEILQSLKEKYDDIKNIFKTTDDESFGNISIIVIYLEKFLRPKTSVITRYITSTDWFMAYSASREFCGTLVLVFELWTRVTRDFFWPYVIASSGNYLSRFPIELECPYSTHEIAGVKIKDDSELTAILESPLTFG